MTGLSTYVIRACDYADNVVAGIIPACVHVRRACQRFLDDLERDDIWLDQDEADRWCRFQEKLPHVKGRWAAKSEKFRLSDWQVFCDVNIFGFKRKSTGLRRFREAYIEVNRKNGKSFWTAARGLGMTVLDGEHGAEVYCGATTEKQAWEIFRPAKQIAERMPALRKRFGLEVNAKTLAVPANGSRFEPVIGNPGDGSSPSCGIADEFHEHRTSDLVDTFKTGMGAREQPLMIYITTAGSDMGGPCYEKRADVVNILSGAVEDDSIFGIIYTIDDNDAWDTEEAIVKANPNLGVSVSLDFLLGELAQARRSPSKQTAYRTKHIGQWVGAKSAWMNMLAYQASERKALNLQDYVGRRCYVALDLASKIDIASKALLFPPETAGDRWAAFVSHYLPEDVILEGGNTRYKAWHQSGHLIATPGNVIDFEYIEDELIEDRSRFQIETVAYDPFQATQFAVHMLAEGFPMVEYGATVKNFSEPMKQLEALILGALNRKKAAKNKQIEFAEDPVLRWMFGNVVAKRDKKDNIFPDKEAAKNKIDGAVALIMALGVAIRNNEGDQMDDDYELMTV